MEQNKFVSKPMTAAQVAEAVKYSTKYVSNKMPTIIKYKKAVKVSGYKRPAQYVFYEPIHDLFPASGLSHAVKTSGSSSLINYRRFCSDPFRLTTGSRVCQVEN